MRAAGASMVILVLSSCRVVDLECIQCWAGVWRVGEKKLPSHTYAGANMDGSLIWPFPLGSFLSGKPAQFPLLPVAVTAACVLEHVDSELVPNTVTSFYSEQPLGLCLQDRLEATEAKVTVSSEWGQKEHALTFPLLSAILLMFVFVWSLWPKLLGLL